MLAQYPRVWSKDLSNAGQEEYQLWLGGVHFAAAFRETGDFNRPTNTTSSVPQDIADAVVFVAWGTHGELFVPLKVGSSIRVRDTDNMPLRLQWPAQASVRATLVFADPEAFEMQIPGTSTIAGGGF